MEKACVLFSGGKDSCLVALMLSKFFEIELVTYNFGLLENYKKLEEIAKKLGFNFTVAKLDKEILSVAMEQVIQDGFPNNGITYIHKKAIEKVTENFKIISDGVRRDDRVPVLSLAEIKSIEDRFDVHYIQPLMGYSRRTVNLLVERFFEIKEYKSSSGFIGAEYEFELKEIIKNKYGEEKIQEIFPSEHTHTIVLKLKNK
ncbi:MAG: alpha hydrolase [Patescibacteria group bacterium]|nr:alpha hydrolase [Patescibacteria group bacterium]